MQGGAESCCLFVIGMRHGGSCLPSTCKFAVVPSRIGFCQSLFHSSTNQQILWHNNLYTSRSRAHILSLSRTVVLRTFGRLLHSNHWRKLTMYSCNRNPWPSIPLVVCSLSRSSSPHAERRMLLDKGERDCG